jgi:hypothetical protein
MLKMPDTKARYFSVKHSTKIQGTRYTPSVCYPLSSGLQGVIEEMAAKGLAMIYPEKVRFVTGAPYPAKKPGTGASVLRPSSASMQGMKGAAKPSAQAPAVATDRQSRKSGRSAYAAQSGREFE